MRSCEDWFLVRLFLLEWKQPLRTEGVTSQIVTFINTARMIYDFEQRLRGYRQRMAWEFQDTESGNSILRLINYLVNPSKQRETRIVKFVSTSTKLEVQVHKEQTNKLEWPITRMARKLINFYKLSTELQRNSRIFTYEYFYVVYTFITKVICGNYLSNRQQDDLLIMYVRVQQ